MLPNQSQLDPRVQRTRDQIEQAFLEELDQKSLQSVTVGDITRRAGVNRATFYAHFDDKYALFDHVVRMTFSETLNAHLITTDPVYSPENMRKLIQATCDYFSYLNNQCPPTERLNRPVAETQVQALLYETLCTWFPPTPSQTPIHQSNEEPQENYAALFLSWAIFGTVLQTVGSSLNVNTDALVTQLDGQVHRYLAAKQ